MALAGPPPPLSQRVFSKYDRDGSGSIDHSEFQNMVYDMGYYLDGAELEVALKVLDSNSTGVIEYAEFLQWWKSHDRGAALQMSESELKQVEQATTYFQYFDKDRSGSIEKKEFAQLHEDLVRNGLTTLSEADAWQELNTDDDNSNVSFNEYIRWLLEHGFIKAHSLQT